MGHSYCSCRVHNVFSTKDRRKSISPSLQVRLWPYLGGIARENDMKALAVGGTSDPVHMLVSLPPTISIAKAVQLIKGSSSKWIHDTFAAEKACTWQEGYGAFSIGMSGVDDTIAYIKAQEEHHRGKTFKDEFSAFLKWHGIEYDRHYAFG